MDNYLNAFGDLNQPILSGKTDTTVVEVKEEFINIERKLIETGKVLISRSVSEETSSINIPIINESYEVHHMPGSSELVDTPPVASRKVGDTFIISVIREVSVVVKKYQLIEEIHIVRNLSQTPLSQEVTLRKENINIKRTSQKQ